MITITLTYRNRDLEAVKKCLESLSLQRNMQFKVHFVNYGSPEINNKPLLELINNYQFISYTRCETQNQLWCKSKAINIALKQCDTVYFFVGDIDMIFHDKFIDVLYSVKDTTTYFQVGFLSETESKENKAFSDYKIKFKTNLEATGMTLYQTELLKSINGYDEFYNGWGSEDTDVHVRLKNLGCKVSFYDKEVLMLHQWHPKVYRTKKSTMPFHSNLECINNEYLNFTQSTNKTKANLYHNWGFYNPKDYQDLKTIKDHYHITNKSDEVKAFVSNVLLQEKDKVIRVQVKEHKMYKSLKNAVKLVLNKKVPQFLNMQNVNDYLLEHIIYNLKNNAYSYAYHVEEKRIELTIKL